MDNNKIPSYYFHKKHLLIQNNEDKKKYAYFIKKDEMWSQYMKNILKNKSNKVL
jgi:hypothetical protein